MKGFLNNRRGSCALSALCFIALGAVLLIWPDLSRVWICRLLGLALLGTGIVYTVLHFIRAKTAAVVFQYDLVLGIILGLVGIWLLTSPNLIISFIQYILGAILVIHGILDLQGALNLRSAGIPRWWISGVIAAVTLLFGAVILWNPFASINALLMLVGIALIYDGVSDLIILFDLTRAFRKVKEEEAREMQEETEENSGPVEEIFDEDGNVIASCREPKQ